MSVRVLVVEDEAMVAIDIAQQLNEAGFVVVGPAPSVTKALKLIVETGCDVAVLDVNLRDETAEPVARELRSRRIQGVTERCSDAIALLSHGPATPLSQLGHMAQKAKCKPAKADVRGVTATTGHGTGRGFQRYKTSDPRSDHATTRRSSPCNTPAGCSRPKLNRWNLTRSADCQ